MTVARQRELGTAEIKDILAEAAALGALSVRFTGGEPLLREDFVDLYLFARRLGLKVLLFTNARLITPELADLFARIPPLEKIEVTVYGMKPQSYEAVSRVPGSYEEFRRGVGTAAGARDTLCGQRGAVASEPLRNGGLRGLGGDPPGHGYATQLLHVF